MQAMSFVLVRFMLLLAARQQFGPLNSAKLTLCNDCATIHKAWIAPLECEEIVFWRCVVVWRARAAIQMPDIVPFACSLLARRQRTSRYNFGAEGAARGGHAWQNSVTLAGG